MTFKIIALANNFKYMNNYFMIHLFQKESVSENLREFGISVLLFIDSVIEHHIKDNNEDITMLANYLSSSYRVSSIRHANSFFFVLNIKNFFDIYQMNKN